MTKKEQVLSYIQKKNIKLTDEQQKKLDSMNELSDEELDAVSGGCFSVPDNPTCPECGSTDTYTINFPSMMAYCRKCGNEWPIRGH